MLFSKINREHSFDVGGDTSVLSSRLRIKPEDLRLTAGPLGPDSQELNKMSSIIFSSPCGGPR
jgi:hypothetical protein